MLFQCFIIIIINLFTFRYLEWRFNTILRVIYVLDLSAFIVYELHLRFTLQFSSTKYHVKVINLHSNIKMYNVLNYEKLTNFLI